MTVEITVDRDGLTNGLQLSIGDSSGGFRLSGPKFNGSSKTLLRFPLTNARDLDEIEAYCRKARTALKASAVGTDGREASGSETKSLPTGDA